MAENAGQKPPSAKPRHGSQLPYLRCNSTDTKFRYYNNCNLAQPRHFCNTCRRYWTEGGTLRNVPIGGGTRKNKRLDTASGDGGLELFHSLSPDLHFHKIGEDIVLFVNAGASRSMESDSGIIVMSDKFFEGGDTFQTEKFIAEGDCSFIYQSARLGNFFYKIENLPPGDYFLDLHFVEIIHTHGPKGKRVFNVLIQEEKILDHFDIFSVVGSNKPLQLVNARVSIQEDGILLIRFEGIIGSPIVSGICIRRASMILVPHHNHMVCKNCSTEIEFPSAQKKANSVDSNTDNICMPTSSSPRVLIEEKNGPSAFLSKNLKVLKQTLSSTKAGMQLMQMKFHEEIKNLGMDWNFSLLLKSIVFTNVLGASPVDVLMP